LAKSDSFLPTEKLPAHKVHIKFKDRHLKHILIAPNSCGSPGPSHHWGVSSLGKASGKFPVFYFSWQKAED
jgi:hypothetical protein